jgi:hypothetical protein
MTNYGNAWNRADGLHVGQVLLPQEHVVHFPPIDVPM